MAYKKPGAYARFIPTASAIPVTAGSTRTMALIGTGKMYFDVLNELVTRNAKNGADELSYENVFEVYTATNKTIKANQLAGLMTSTSNTVGTIDKFTQGEYDVSAKKVTGGDFALVTEGDGTSRIVWAVDVDTTTTAPKNGTVTKVAGAYTDLESLVEVAVDKPYLVESGTYRIEVVYVDAAANLSTYAVIKDNTNETIGEFGVGQTVTDAIPGVTLTVGDFYSDEDIAVGQFAKVTTVASTLKAGLPSAYYVHYNYKRKNSDLEPKVFNNYTNVVNEYGNYEVLSSGKIINSLSLGAEIAFLNGVTQLVLVQAKSDNDTDIIEAIDKLERDIVGASYISTVIPLVTSPEVRSKVATHVIAMSEEETGKERMAYVAAAKNENVSNIIARAQAISNERVVFVAPGNVVKDIKDLNTGKTSSRKLDASYLAVAVASIGLKNDPAEPLTNKYISGFSSLSELYKEREKNELAEAGVTVLEQYGSNIKIRHGLTTATDSVNSMEITLVQIKDYVIESVRKNLADIYVGKKLLPSVVSDIQNTLTNLLSQFVAQEVVIGYGSVSVARSTEDPRAVDVSFEIEAVYPLNYINISFSFSGIS